MTFLFLILDKSGKLFLSILKSKLRTLKKILWIFFSNYRKTPLLVPATNTAFYFFLQCLLRVLLTFWDFFFQKLKPDFMHLVPVFKVNLSFFWILFRFFVHHMDHGTNTNFWLQNYTNKHLFWKLTTAIVFWYFI